ncbi:MAG TPA: DCC1-like thiol-disulfide oxidoreductase family protein [Steroidobacteraceae bacterium]
MSIDEVFEAPPPRARREILASLSKTELTKSELAARVLNPTDFETNIRLSQGRAWLKSQGTIRMFQLLGFPWSTSVLLRIVPASLLDRLYSLVARNRLK